MEDITDADYAHAKRVCKSDCNGTQTYNHLVRKQTLNHLVKLAND